MLKIVADDKIPFLRGALEGKAKIIYLPGNQIQPEHVKDADVLIVRTRTQCNESLLKNSSVRLITSATIGYDHIDTHWCEQNNIRWTNAPGCNANSVVQYVASALAYISKHHSVELSQKTLGIIGAGNIGSRLANLAATLGIKTLINDPPRAAREGDAGFTELDHLLDQADIITLHIPLEKTVQNNTFQLVNEDFLQKIPKGSWFINSSRGEIASTKALISALKDSHLAGAVLDVWENEPHINRELMDASKLSTPHIAGYSADGKANGTAVCVQTISKHFNLGLDQWYPPTLPLPENPVITNPCKNNNSEEMFRFLALESYDILSDSRNLRLNPSAFEKQRENYPIRREPGAWQVQAVNCSEAEEFFIKTLGYSLI